MKRLKIKSEVPNFIGSWNISNDNLCDNLIKFFEKNINLHKQGTVGGGINLKIKKTQDIPIDPINLESDDYEIFKQYYGKCHASKGGGEV